MNNNNSSTSTTKAPLNNSSPCYILSVDLTLTPSTIFNNKKLLLIRQQNSWRIHTHHNSSITLISKRSKSTTLVNPCNRCLIISTLSLITILDALFGGMSIALYKWDRRIGRMMIPKLHRRMHKIKKLVKRYPMWKMEYKVYYHSNLKLYNLKSFKVDHCPILPKKKYLKPQ